MTVRIIETNDAPLKSVDVDGVTVDLIENALKNAREEMDAVLFRTAMSPGIREQGDCFPMIANRDGKMVVGQFGSFIGPFPEAYDDEIEEGDIILTNDPYMCNAAVSHLPDWVVLVPIFKDGRHIAWSAMFGHMSDNGGMVPGSIPIEATTIYQEGIRIPPTKLYKKGVLQEGPARADPAQRAHAAVEPLRSECAGRRLQHRGAKRVRELAERFGDEVLDSPWT
jgi:N-methylhydantoinase B